MNFFKFTIFIFIAVFLISATAQAQITAKETIKAGILFSQEKITIASDKKYFFISGDKKFRLSPGKIQIQISNKKAVICDKSYALPLKFYSSSFLMVNKTLYRGNIIINLSSDNKLNVINELSTEDYLKGILPKEANASWNNETLKAQAVISRTYALKNLSRHSKEGFDICSSVHCQVYGGASAETKNCNKAIFDTKDEVVVYNNELAQTFFHAACGGYTEDPKYVWEWKMETPDYLKGIKDKYCKNSPHANWETKIPEKTIRNKLIKAGYKIGKIKSIKTSGNTKGKAKQAIIIKHSKGVLKLNSYKFRLTVDPWLIKSTMINTIKYSNGNFIFKGKGWGHKIGLCQWGAKEMGDRGFSYKKILKFYYPNTKIGKVKYAK